MKSYKRNKLIAAMMVFFMIFSVVDFGTISEKVFAKENRENFNIRVRVEGLKDKLFDKEIPIKDEVTVKDLIISAIGEENVKGLDKGFVSEILGEKQTDSMGWMYYFLDEEGNVKQGDVIKTQKIKDIKGKYYKDVVWHRAKWNDGITCIPKVNIENTGNKYKIKIVEENSMMDIDQRPSKDVNVKVYGVGEYKTNEKGEVNFSVTPGKHKVDIYKIKKDSHGKEYPAIVRQSFEIEGEETDETLKLKDVIEECKKYYDNSSTKYDIALLLNNIQSGLVKDFELGNSNNAANIADSIMGIVSIGKNPYEYEGENYVQKLIDSQNENGKFVIKSSDEKSITAQSEAIIALDMVHGKYDKDKALENIVTYFKDSDGKISFEGKDIDSITKAMIALSKHKDKKEVLSLINSSIDHLKNVQLEGGGYDYYSMGNSPYSTGPVIQALIAVGENPLDVKWTKQGANLIDSLLKCIVRSDKNEFKGFEFVEGMGGGYSDEKATSIAFMAISDLYRKSSMYHNFSFDVKEKEDPQKIINSEIEDIKSYYKDKSSYDYNILLGLKSAGVESSTLLKKMTLKNKDSMLFIAQDIMSIIAVDKNPRNYNGKNYIDKLLKDIKNPKETHIVSKSYYYALIALDMADYKGQDLKTLIEKVKSEANSFNSVKETSLAIISLFNHKEDEGVSKIIENALEYLKNEQLGNASFTLDKKNYSDGDSEETSIAIEALIECLENPLSDKWVKNDKNVLDALLSFKMGKGYIFNKIFAAYNQDMYTSFVLRSLVALKNNTTVFNKFKIKYDKEKDKTSIIKNILEDSKEKCLKNSTYNFRQALSLNHSSNNIFEDIKDIQEKFKVEIKSNDVCIYAKNIMGIIASGKNPYRYNGENYVNKLLQCEIKDGKDKGKFVIQDKDSENPLVQAYSICALDMAKASYNKEDSLKALCDMSKDGIYNNVETTANIITILSKHKCNKEVNDLINSSLKYFEDKQNSKAGYDELDDKNNLNIISSVIQALIANDINPLDDKWCKNGESMVDVIYQNKKDGKIEDQTTNEKVFMAIADLYKEESMFKNIVFEDNSTLGKTIKELKLYYTDKDKTYNYIQSLALNKIGFSKDMINKNVQLREEEPEFLNYDTLTTNLCKNIIALKSAGVDPKNYNKVNYVYKLVNCQREDGQFKLKEDENTSIKAQAYSIIALDICKEKYHINKAVNVLKQAVDTLNESSTVSNISTIMIALSNHNDIEGVNEKIKICINKLKNLQTDDGGFGYSKKHLNKCSEYTSEAISALVACGEDVLSIKWSENGKTPIDNLLSYKKGDCFIYNSAKRGYDEYTDKATGKAIGALVSVYNNESIFKSIFTQELEEKKEFQIKNLTKNKEFKLGEDAKVNVEALNTLNEDKKVALVVGLFDKDNKLIDYVSVYKQAEKDKKIELEAILKLPKTGEFKIKAFVWDSLENMKPLSDSINIAVK